MIDERDLQLMVCEKLMEMNKDHLIELTTRLTGHDSPGIIAIGDPKRLKDWLRYMVYVIGMRVKIPVSD